MYSDLLLEKGYHASTAGSGVLMNCDAPSSHRVCGALFRDGTVRRVNLAQ